MRQTFSPKELSVIFSEDKWKVLAIRRNVRDMSEEGMLFMNLDVFPFYIEPTGMRSELNIHPNERDKEINKPTIENLDFKGVMDTGLVRIDMVAFTFNQKRRRGYAIAYVEDHKTGKKDYVEFWREGIGLYVLTLEEDRYREEIFNRAKNILIKIIGGLSDE